MMNWTDLPKVIIKVEMTKRRWKYVDLVVALRRLGIYETEASIRNKVSRSSFSATFLLQCLEAMDIHSFDVRSYGLPEPRGPIPAGD